MIITCEDILNPAVKSAYRSVDKFIFAFPAITPTTPLGPHWKFQPCFLPSKYKRFKEQLENFEVRPSDVWSITRLKTGSCWTQEMLWLLINDLNYEAAKNERLSNRCPYVDLIILSEEQEINEMDRLNEMSSPRLIKSHLPAGLLPKQLWTVVPKIVYTARGIKDTAISLFHHLVNIHGYKHALPDFLEAFLENRAPYAPNHSHFKDFWYLRNEANVLFLTYEEMKNDMRNVLRKTSNFLNKSYSEDAFNILDNHLLFSSMKKNPSLNDRQDNFSPCRKGVVGSHETEMPKEFIERFDKWTAEYNLKNGTTILP